MGSIKVLTSLKNYKNINFHFFNIKVKTAMLSVWLKVNVHEPKILFLLRMFKININLTLLIQ